MRLKKLSLGKFIRLLDGRNGGVGIPTVVRAVLEVSGFLWGVGSIHILVRPATFDGSIF